MPYDPRQHRQAEREHCRRLLEAGEGWFDYVRDKAAKLEQGDPMLHRGLLEAVQAFIEKARQK